MNDFGVLFTLYPILYSESSGGYLIECRCQFPEACFGHFSGYDRKFVHLREFDGFCLTEGCTHIGKFVG